MNWKKGLGFGVLIWIIMFVVISALIAFGLTPAGGPMSPTVNVITILISLVVAYLAARNIAPHSYGMALGYGLVFAVVGIILDYFISQKYAPGMFSSVWYWVSYVLLVLVPLLAVKKVPMQVPPQQQ